MTMRPQVVESLPIFAPELYDDQPSNMVLDADRESTGPLLLVESSACSRASLQRVLTTQGFEVIAAAGLQRARAAVAQQRFAYVVINLRLGDGYGLDLVKQLRQCNARMRIVVVTDTDSFASVVLALRAGADDYLAQPAGAGELVDALLDRAPILPPVPDTPLGLGRTCWEHIMRLHEQCGRNVTHTAQRLGIHRRSLQRILGKRAPLPRPLQR